jgi:hypothetical protein
MNFGRGCICQKEICSNGQGMANEIRLEEQWLTWNQLNLVVSLHPETNKTIENKGWFAVEVARLWLARVSPQSLQLASMVLPAYR